MATDRTILRNLLNGISSSEKTFSNSAEEVALAIGTRRTCVSGVALNTAASNVLLDTLAPSEMSGNAVVQSFTIAANLNVVQNTTNYVVVTLWKRDTNGGTKTTVAEVNTANLSANVNFYTPIAATTLNNAAAEVTRNASYGYDVAVTAAGITANSTGTIQVTLRPK